MMRDFLYTQIIILDQYYPNTISRYPNLGRTILAWYADLDSIRKKKNSNTLNL